MQVERVIGPCVNVLVLGLVLKIGPVCLLAALSVMFPRDHSARGFGA